MIYSLPAGGDFSHLLTIFLNRLGPDQARQTVGPDLEPNRLQTFYWYFLRISLERK